MNASRYRKLLYILDQIRSTACSRNQHVMGSRGGVLIYVRINDQSLSGIWSKQSPFRVQLAGQAVVGHIVEQSLLHRYILRFLPMGDEREFDKWKVSKEFLLLNMI